MTSSLAPGMIQTADQQRRIAARTWALMYAGVLGVSGVLGLVTLWSAPAPLGLPLTMLVLASLLVAIKPLAGLYLVAFFTMLTDGSISPAYPFVKNMSSRESVLFVSDKLILSPLELLLALTLTAVLLRVLIDRAHTSFIKGALFRPMMIFTALVFAGLVFGLATGGNRYAATWEFRPLLCLPLFYVVLVNLVTTRRQYLRLTAVMLVAITFHTLLSLQVWSRMSSLERQASESLVAHGSAVQLSVVIFVTMAVWVVPEGPRRLRWFTLIIIVPVAWVWLASQRRAAVIALAVGLIVLAILLTKLNPRVLRRVGPVFAILLAAYVVAFWHSESTTGFPAQALKTVVAPGETSQRDQASDLYRVIENFDITTTIRAKPLTGLGFGQEFYRPVPLPDISFFPFYEYIPHNSILWIWIKMGFFGFITMLYLFGAAIRWGTAAIMHLPRGPDALVLMAAVVYLVMYLVFAYVDIAWDTRSMICVALAMAVCSEYLRLPGPPPRRSHDRDLEPGTDQGSATWPTCCSPNPPSTGSSPPPTNSSSTANPTGAVRSPA
jgi:O-antigen ligase